MKKTILFLLAITTLAIAGYYYKDKIGEQVKNFQKTDFNQVILEVQKKVLTPDPLHIGGEENQVVLFKAKIIEETNLQRQNNGLPLLVENAKLEQAALVKANDMFENQYFEHVSLFGVDPGELVSNLGYEYIVAGENLILGNFDSEYEVVENWMTSRGHRENILSSKFSEIGVAIIKGVYEGETVWIGVQEFGRPLSDCVLPDKSIETKIKLNKTNLDELEVILKQKKQQIESVNSRSAVYRQMAEDYNALVAQYNLLTEETKAIINVYNSQVNIFNTCANSN